MTQPKKRHHKFRAGDLAIWNDGVQDIPVTVVGVGRDACGIYCRVRYQTIDGPEHDKVHPSKLRPVPRRMS